MSKILMSVFIGVFVGALTYEILNRTRPELIKRLEAKASEKLDNILRPGEARA